jgi:hypothetical protein
MKTNGILSLSNLKAKMPTFFIVINALKIKTPLFLRAVKFGSTIEAGLGMVAVVSVLAGGIGPCGPTGDVPLAVSLIHKPGAWMAGLLVGRYSLMNDLLTITLTTMLLSAASYAVIEVAARHDRQQP